MIFHVFCLIKKLSKMPKFAKFTLVISLFRYSRKNFLDRFLKLPWGMTCLQNVFFDVDFLIYFELKWHFCVFQIFLLNQCTTGNRYFDWHFTVISRISAALFNPPSCSVYSNELLPGCHQIRVSLPVYRFLSCVLFRKKFFLWLFKLSF